MLLQILEDGRLSDAKGKVVNFANTVIIMTSNLGVRDVNQAQTALGFQTALATEETDVDRRHKVMKEKIEEELKKTFRPEFLNRVDAVIIFKPFTTQQIRMIVELQLGRLAKHLEEQEIFLSVTEKAMDRIAEEGFDRIYGARPLRRVIRTRIEDQLSEELLRGKVARGSNVVVDIDDEGFKFSSSPRERKPEPAASAQGAPAKDS
jgi:ATP-dependent Clp protease ATP-binding subunit ClpC